MASLVDTEIVLACRCHYKYDNCDLTAIGSSFFFFLFNILSSCQGSMVLVVVQCHSIMVKTYLGHLYPEPEIIP